MTVIATLVFILCCAIAGAMILLSVFWMISQSIRGHRDAQAFLALAGIAALTCSFVWSSEVLFG